MARENRSAAREWSSSYELERHCNSASSTVAQPCDTSRLATLPQRVEQRHDKTSAGGAQWMAERYGAPVDVYPLPVPLQGLAVRHDLRCERLVDFEQIPVGDRRAGLLEQLVQGRLGGFEEPQRISRGTRVGDDPRDRP